ncbi:hypothetical protein FIBSPDRAFT_817601 [Athelia psychrophila]|uniref:Uncharacterized protein n=1 Tax=Athelia psychrophila TaxID=1759441 RepID=A0A166RJY7_9AGAM|nr:hypothetical protein FIBSPDRAFT_817601 [Fibularhizoctonia sp. CBS 109695]
MTPQEMESGVAPESPTTPMLVSAVRTRSKEINDELVCLEGDEEYQCLAYGDVTQLWRRKMKSTGRIVNIPGAFPVVPVSDFKLKVAIKEFRMISTDGVGDINGKFEVVSSEVFGQAYN